MDKVPTYSAIHQRLRYHRGRASDLPCTHCADRAREWALIGEPKWFDSRRRPYTDDLNAYTPLCGSCHQRLDRGLPPCPHGPERDRLKNGSCRGCFNENRTHRYANDPEYREAEKAKTRNRYATDPEYREAVKARSREQKVQQRAQRADLGSPS